MFTPNTCGNCRFARAVDQHRITCYGVPPTPAIVGGGRNVAGQQTFAIELMRPQIARIEPACSLHKLALPDTLDLKAMPIPNAVDQN